MCILCISVWADLNKDAGEGDVWDPSALRDWSLSFPRRSCLGRFILIWDDPGELYERSTPPLVLCAWEPGLWSQFLSFQGDTCTAMPPPQPTALVDWSGPINNLTLSTSHSVLFPHPWLKVSFSGNLWFMSSLSFYFQFGSGIRCTIYSPTLPPFCPCPLQSLLYIWI